MFRITTQLRTAAAVDPNAPVNECTMITAEGDDITYRYDNTDNTLYLVTNDNNADDDYVLCDSVTAMTFTKEVVTEDAVTQVKGVQVAITVESGGVQKKAAAAAVVRRNLD